MKTPMIAFHSEELGLAPNFNNDKNRALLKALNKNQVSHKRIKSMKPGDTIKIALNESTTSRDIYRILEWENSFEKVKCYTAKRIISGKNSTLYVTRINHDCN